jgi:preprotein translocase subunit YajC
MVIASTNWGGLLAGLIPLVVLLLLWLFMMRRPNKLMKRNAQFMDRQEELLERIAVALEKRARSEN